MSPKPETEPSGVVPPKSAVSSAGVDGTRRTKRGRRARQAPSTHIVTDHHRSRIGRRPRDLRRLQDPAGQWLREERPTPAWQSKPFRFFIGRQGSERNSILAGDQPDDHPRRDRRTPQLKVSWLHHDLREHARSPSARPSSTMLFRSM